MGRGDAGRPVPNVDANACVRRRFGLGLALALALERERTFDDEGAVLGRLASSKLVPVVVCRDSVGDMPASCCNRDCRC